MKTMKIPSGWKLCEQSDVSAFYNGRAYKLSEWETEGTPVIRLQNLTGTGNEYYYSNLKLPEHQYADNGDLLYMWSATFGPKIWQGEKAIYHYHIWKVVCKDDLLDQSFMYYNLDFITESMKSKTNGSTMLHFTKKGMEEHEILLPPLAEQEKIAKYLSTVDKKIDLIDQKIAETEKLKTGLMQKLFSEGVGVQDENGNWQPHTEFRTTSIGQVPKTWQDAQIGDYVSELVSGVSVNSYDKQKTENEIGVLKTSAVIGGNFYPEFHKTVKPEDIARAKTTVKENTLVISRMNTPSLVGEFGYVSKDYNDLYLPDRLWMTVPTSKPHDVKALSYLMQHYPVKKSIKELATGTSNSMKNISKGKFLAVYVPHIPYEEQMMIREILSTVDIKLELLNKQKAETQQLKKGLMQKLLTGEWRVPVEETEAA
ncbi:restriction endonuclease subunit S [Vibrio alginolyticus]|nr:restriction endonuclease subunit S [Vibrio alginolyticus]ELA8376538.1 restriction endonuclease subunit S [Vibrio alginolyticus]ELB2817276.1 restriction endonuclease subunit S [Vibrio alginolyticus]